MTTTAALDQAKSEAFAAKMIEMLNQGALALMVSMGHRTRLFDTMSGMSPATTHEIAARAKLSERYVREWLGAMVTAGIVEYDRHATTYFLPPEHAAALTRSAAPNNIAASAQWIGVLGCAEDSVVQAFEHGRGVPYSAYPRFHEVMAEESEQTVVAGLLQHIIPLVPALQQRLEAGIDVLDVGCGAGRAMRHLADAFPNSRFVGCDFSAEAVAAALAGAEQRGLRNVCFDAADASALRLDGRYDLVTAFDAIHDQARPDEVLRNIARALRPGGVFLMQDIAASSLVHENIGHPIGTFLYTISCMHCMSVSLSNGGPGLGATWGRQKALEMLKVAGFGDVEVHQLPHDFQNDYYVARVAPAAPAG